MRGTPQVHEACLEATPVGRAEGYFFGSPATLSYVLAGWLPQHLGAGAILCSA